MNAIKKIVIVFVLGVVTSITYSSERLYVTQDKRFAFNNLKQLSKDYSFLAVTKTELPSGIRYKLVQFYKELLVWNTMIISKKITIDDLEVDDLIAGEFLIKVEHDLPSVTPSLSREDAIDIATRKYKDSMNIKSINTQLFVKSYNQVAKLVYLVDYFVDEPFPKRPFYIIEAITGEILESWEGLPT